MSSIVNSVSNQISWATAAIGSWHSEVEQMAEESARQMGFDYSGGEVDMNLPDCSIYEAGSCLEKIANRGT